jgi:hypothetical protein
MVVTIGVESTGMGMLSTVKHPTFKNPVPY